MGFRIFTHKDGELVETGLDAFPSHRKELHVMLGHSDDPWDHEYANPTDVSDTTRGFVALEGDYYARPRHFYSGHLYRGAPHETDTDCGNCDGSSCMDDVPQKDQCRKVCWLELAPIEPGSGMAKQIEGVAS